MTDEYAAEFDQEENKNSLPPIQSTPQIKGKELNKIKAPTPGNHILLEYHSCFKNITA